MRSSEASFISPSYAITPALSPVKCKGANNAYTACFSSSALHADGTGDHRNGDSNNYSAGGYIPYERCTLSSMRCYAGDSGNRSCTPGHRVQGNFAYDVADNTTYLEFTAICVNTQSITDIFCLDKTKGGDFKDATEESSAEVGKA
ncbi:hypothetical protein OAU50_08970, partial [Planctomycetota bacterium]|nr:hypothetical protein [Planctomycetota bacterium]